MVDTLTFALYGLKSQLSEGLFPVLKGFETKKKIQIQTIEMSLEEAWPQLLQYTIHGDSPDLARVGTIWTSSLVALNSLRPFKESEIASLGGKNAFFEPIWQSSVHPEDTRVWAIPFSSYNYVLFYRRDLLEKAGVDKAGAFSTSQAMLETLKRLSSSGVQSPWVIPTGEHYRARLHILASWIWGAGGHFLSDDGKNILLGKPEAMKGMKEFFEMHRFLASSDHGLSTKECRRRYARGRAAIMIGGPDTVSILKSLNPAPGVIANTGASALPGTPWIGGSSLVVWNDVLSNPEKERNIMRLITYLTDKSIQEQIYNRSKVMPARAEALSDLELEPPELVDVEKMVLSTGRSYRPYPIWVRIQNDLIKILDQITVEFLEDTSKDVLPIIKKYTNSVVKRYNLILSSM